MDVREALGRAVGGILAPLAAEASLMRGAPVFHADGVVVEADVSPVVADDPLGSLGAALAGPALVRFSEALQRYQEGRDPPDVFGAAVRFGAGTSHPQDLLFATFRSIWEAPLAAFRTNPHDFLANEYSTALPFHVPGTSTWYVFRLVPESKAGEGKDHVDRLERAVKEGAVTLRLEGRPDTRGARFTPLASIALHAVVSPPPGEEALRFNPFRDGAEVVPAGFFQATRAAVYPASILGAAVARGKMR